MINVLVWNEFYHEKTEDRVKEIYPEGIHATISAFLSEEELIKIALSEDGSSLEFISKENITEELSNMAISSNGLAIYFVPKKMQTLKMCREAVLNNPRAILKVKKSIAPELYQEFIQDNYNAWAHFTSEELISLENNLKK